jgi:tetratricopeptide (TPR) repeat protein
VTTDRDRLALAKELYERSVFGGDPDALAEADEVLDAVEADLALARGRVHHARYLADRLEVADEKELFEQAATLYRSLGDLRGEAEALFWIGTFEQVVRGDNAAALPPFLRAHDLASEIDDRLTLSYVVRHLGFVDMAAGDMAAARGRLEQSVALRREIGFLPGVAAGLLALAELAVEDGRPQDARALLDEATATARDSGAQGTLRWIQAVRSALAEQAALEPPPAQPEPEPEVEREPEAVAGPQPVPDPVAETDPARERNGQDASESRG